MSFSTAQQVNLPACSSHCLFKSVVFNLGVATPMKVIRHFSRGSERYLVFVRNPFVADSDVVNVFSGNGATQEEFIALKNDSTAEGVFKEMSLHDWSAMVTSYSRVASTAVQLLMPFSSTWLCEACFSTLLETMNKARNKLIAELDQRCALSTTEPRNDKLVTKMQHQPSHQGSCYDVYKFIKSFF